MTNKPAIGIYLGLNHSVVAVHRNGEVEIIANEGSRKTPSWVAYTNTKRLVGQDAMDQANHNAANTVYGKK